MKFFITIQLGTSFKDAIFKYFQAFLDASFKLENKDVRN